MLRHTRVIEPSRHNPRWDIVIEWGGWRSWKAGHALRIGFRRSPLLGWILRLPFVIVRPRYVEGR